METIIKYNNRKHYSKTLSQYVNIDYIADLEATGQKFKVITKDGTDITETVLASAINKVLTNAVKDGKVTRETLNQVLKNLR